MARDPLRRGRAAEIVLRDEGLEHLHRGLGGLRGHVVVHAQAAADRGGVLHVRREVRAVAQMAAAAHHRQVHAGAAALQLHGEDVDVLVARRQAALVHRLLVQHARQRRDAVAELGRALELEHLRMPHHRLLQLGHHGLVVAQQEALGVADVARVVGRGNEPHARPRATLDLVQQARARAVGEDGVLARAQAEHLLDQLDRLLDGPRARIRPEVLVLAVDRAAVVRHARERVRDQPQVRVALVVAEQDVELRVQRLDQVVLEQQRLGLGAHHRGLQPRDAADHVADARAAVILLEVARDAALEVARLAHIQHGAGDVEVAIDAGHRGQRGDLGQQLLARGLRRVDGRAIGRLGLVRPRVLVRGVHDPGLDVGGAAELGRRDGERRGTALLGDLGRDRRDGGVRRGLRGFGTGHEPDIVPRRGFRRRAADLADACKIQDLTPATKETAKHACA